MLGNNIYIGPGAKIYGDIIIGKVVPIRENRNDHTKVIKYKDQSKVFRTHEETYIDKNYMHRNGDGYTFAKVK